MANNKNGGWPEEQPLEPPPPIAEAIPQTLSAVTLGRYQAPDWFFAGLISQGASLIVGRPKVGKSWLLLQLAVTAAVGGKFLGSPALGVFPAVYFAAEDDPGRIANRFSKFQVDTCPPGVNLFMRDECDSLAAKYAAHYTFPEFLDLWLTENKGVKIVLVDTEEALRAVWAAHREFEREERDVTRRHYRETREFDKVAHKHRAFIGLVNHTSKRKTSKGGNDPHEEINRANTAFAGATGSMVVTEPPDTDPLASDDTCKLFAIRSRDLVKDQTLAIQQDHFGLFQSLGPWQEHKQTETEAVLMEALKEMIDAKEGDHEGWVTSSQLAGWTSRREPGIKKALTRMAVAGRTTWGKLAFEARRNKGYRLFDPKKNA